MVGVISLSLGTILDRIERCRAKGVRHFQISLPSWGALGDSELSEFFRQQFIRALVWGQSYIAVEFPKVAEAPRTRAEEDALGRSRAYLVAVGYSLASRIGYVADEGSGDDDGGRNKMRRFLHSMLNVRCSMLDVRF